MSVGTVLNTALRSMQANQLALAVASNNVANAQTPGYSRERLVVRPGDSLGGNFAIGTGVEIVRVEAIRSQLIDTRLQQETARKSQDETLTQTLSGIEVLFNESDDSGLLRILSEFFNSFHALSTDPASLTFREQVRTSALTMADSFRSRGESLRNLQSTANKAVGDGVAKANNLLVQIAALTASINEQELQEPANNLRDQRSTLVRELSKLMEVRELESGGDYHLTTSSNRLLVLNGAATPLTTEAGPSGSLIIRSGQADITGEIGSGELKANISLRDQYIPKYMTALDAMAYEITQQVNSIHSTAYDLYGSTGTSFFTPLASSADAARLMALSTQVAADPKKIAAAKDTAGQNNLAAIDLGNLLHSSVFTGGSVTGQYGNLVFSIGSDVSNADSSLRQHEAIEHQLENRRGAISGVSIDEETVQMLGFQRAYEASARIVRTVDELLQTLLGMGA